MKHFTIILCSLFSYLLAGQPISNTFLIQTLEEVDENGPGVSVAIVKNDKIIAAASKGIANLDYMVPLDNTTNFRLSSTSKQFTAAAIILLAESNMLSLSDPLGKHLKGYSNALGKVTIQQLINHTSGIRDYMSLMMIQGSPHMDFFNSFIGENHHIGTLLQSQKSLSFLPGTKHSYSNSNYWLLSQIVKSVTGKSLGAYVQTHMFIPLGMNNTKYIETAGETVKNRAAGYVCPCPECLPHEYRFQSTVVGDGGVVSSLEDLTKWETEFHNRTYFSDFFWEAMLTKGVLLSGDTLEYASGLIYGEKNGTTLISHSGQNPGYSSDIIRIPSLKTSIILLGNQNWHDVRSIGDNILSNLIGQKASTTTNNLRQKLKAVSLSVEDLAFFCGDYHFLETNEYRSIRLEGDSLRYIRNNGPTSTLVPLSKNQLTFTDRKNVILTFDTSPENIVSISWKDGNIYQSAVSYKKEILSDVDKVKYVGSYYNPELDSEIIISNHNGQLFLQLTKHNIPLEYIQQERFNGMGIFTLSFVNNLNENSKAIILDAPRAEHIVYTFKNPKG